MENRCVQIDPTQTLYLVSKTSRLVSSFCLMLYLTPVRHSLIQFNFDLVGKVFTQHYHCVPHTFCLAMNKPSGKQMSFFPVVLKIFMYFLSSKICIQ